MKWHRIQGVLLRHYYHVRHDTGSLIAPFYWPLIDIILWGLTSLYIRSLEPGISKVVVIFVSGAVLWLLVYRSFYDFAVNIIMERWDKNLINLFAGPLKPSEWITGTLIYAILRVTLSFIFISAMAVILYQVKILSYGLYLVPFIFLLVISGWWIGFAVSGLALLQGRKVEVFIWTMVPLLVPFSAIYYPVSALPKWAQTIAHLLPQSYVFEGMRSVIESGRLDVNGLVISAVLNGIYLASSLLLFRWCFKKLLEKGLVNVY